MTKTASRTLFIGCMLWHTLVALRCFETLNNNRVVMSGDPDWQYCVFLQEYNRTLGAFQPPSLNGDGSANDALAAYNAVFDQNIDGYSVLSNCVFEEYRSVIPPSDEVIDEIFLRCFCTTDLCNRGVSIQEFLTNLAGRKVTAVEELMRF